MDELELHAYNLRQYDHMDSLLDRFREKRLPMGELVNTLYLLLSHLKTVDEVWESEFEEAWSNLEIEYASALNDAEKALSRHNGGELLSSDAQTRVMQTVANLKQLLAPKLLEAQG